MSSQRETHLPAYEPPILPLTPSVVENLKRPVRDVKSPADFLKNCFTFLSSAAQELGDLSSAANAPIAEQDRVHKAPLFTSEAKAARAELLQDIEAAVRKACDAAAKVEFQTAVVETIHKDETPKSMRVNGIRRARIVRAMREDDGEESEESEDELGEERPCQVEESVWHRYKTGYQKEVEEYEALTDKEKYGTHKDYLNYRQNLWEAQFPEKPTPADSYWFRDAGDGSDSEDEIEIANEVREYKCPLSMQPFVEPMTSRKCPKHSFSKASITDYFATSNRGKPKHSWSVKCPVAGCNNTLVWEDLFNDPDLLRKAARTKEREERLRRQRAMREQDEDDEDEEDERRKDSDGDEEMLDEGTQRKIKKEKSSQAPAKTRRLQRRGNRTVDLDSDDEMA